LLFIALKAFLARKENCGMYEEERDAMGIWFLWNGSNNNKIYLRKRVSVFLFF
jgi:hypothetical protein